MRTKRTARPAKAAFIAKFGQDMAKPFPLQAQFNASRSIAAAYNK